MAHLRFAFHERPAVTVSCLVRGRGPADQPRRASRSGRSGYPAVRVPAAESLLIGLRRRRRSIPAVLAAAGAVAADASEPVTDSNGSAEYKHHLVGVLVGRAVRAAVADAQRRGSVAA